jgi:polyisoprenoid-binding protein YceI
LSTQVKTMKTGNETRDGHLQNASWLDAGKYPQITFKIENVSDVKASGNKATAKATGDFTLHGITKKMTIPFEVTYMPASEATKKRASGDLVMIKADFTVGLKDYNIAGAQGIVGSKVGETIKITAQLYGNTQ